MNRLSEVSFLNNNDPNSVAHIRISELEDAYLEKFIIEVTFIDISILRNQYLFDKLISDTVRLFMRFTRYNKPDPIYIPTEAEIISLDKGFIDAYYDIEFASDKDEILYLTKGYDINKSIITYNFIERNGIELKFDSLFSKNEYGKLSSIWDIFNKEVRALLYESIIQRTN